MDEIFELITDIECELDNAMNTLPEYNANVDSQGYIDGARCDLYYLKDEIERSILDENTDIPGFEGTMGALESL